MRHKMSGTWGASATRSANTRSKRSRRLASTAKGRVHTREWIRKDDDLRAHVALYADKEDAEGMSRREKGAAQVEIALNAWRRNEKDYRESLANLREMGLDPSETLREFGINPD
jgi:hypothetical protein